MIWDFPFLTFLFSLEQIESFSVGHSICHHSKFQLSIESITNKIYNYQCISLLCFIMKSVLAVAIANMDIWRHFFLASYITQVLSNFVPQVSN